MNKTKVCFAAVILLLIGSAYAQPLSSQSPEVQTMPVVCDATSTAARQLKFDGEVPFAGASIHDALSYGCTSILFYRLTLKHPPVARTAEARRNVQTNKRPMTGEPVFYARVHSKERLADSTEQLPLWADGRSCRSLPAAIEGLERALAPKLTGEGPARNAGLERLTVDGAGVVVWAAGQVYPLANASHQFDITYRTNVGTPTADWLQKTLADLRPCLKPLVPTADPPIP